MSQASLSEYLAREAVDTVNAAFRDGFVWAIRGHSHAKSAKKEAAARLGLSRNTLASRLDAAKRIYGLVPDWSLQQAHSAPAEAKAPEVERITRSEKVRFGIGQNPQVIVAQP